RLQRDVERHDNEAMRSRGGVLLQASPHLGALATQLAPHDRDVHTIEIAASRGALRTQLTEFILELRRRQENRAPSVAPSRDPAQRVLVLAADDDWRSALARGLRIASHCRKPT